jgi:polysaccharide deacetylase 2 family uncharacterized protein YibQ
MADDLSAPLGRKKRKQKRAGFDIGRSRLPWARLGFALVALVLIGAAGRIFLVNDPEGGRPTTTVAIATTHNDNALANRIAASKPGMTTITVGPEIPPGAAISVLNPDAPAAAPHGPAMAAVNGEGVIADLAEETKDGPLPKMSPTGETPFAAYSRPSSAVAGSGKPMVAIVVTGLGLNEAGTLKAIDKLPPDISLAFAPYGAALNRTVAAAHAAGHELLLEVPMEPFDYPDTDPGPQTLLTGQPAKSNIGKLYWLMARFGGYIGLINNTGARFTASAADFGPVMEELGTRGLGYLDDGSSNRSIADQLAKANKVPFGRGDIMLDADPSRGQILAALDSLATLAQSKGEAIGVISALPVSIATVAEWTAGLADKNVQLVPVSALMK